MVVFAVEVAPMSPPAVLPVSHAAASAGASTVVMPSRSPCRALKYTRQFSTVSSPVVSPASAPTCAPPSMRAPVRVTLRRALPENVPNSPAGALPQSATCKPWMVVYSSVSSTV